MQVYLIIFQCVLKDSAKRAAVKLTVSIDRYEKHVAIDADKIPMGLSDMVLSGKADSLTIPIPDALVLLKGGILEDTKESLHSLVIFGFITVIGDKAIILCGNDSLIIVS